jgi:hypothetical protein
MDEGCPVEPFRLLITVDTHDFGLLRVAYGEAEITRLQLARGKDHNRCEGYNPIRFSSLRSSLIRTLRELSARQPAKHADLRAVTKADHHLAVMCHLRRARW